MTTIRRRTRSRLPLRRRAIRRYRRRSAWNRRKTWNARIAETCAALVMLIACFGFGAASVQATTTDGAAVPAPTPTAPSAPVDPKPTPTPTAAPTSPRPTATPPPSKPTPAEPVKEGFDYEFMNKTLSGGPIKWACTASIKVFLVGDYPAGADTALAAAVSDLVSVSKLPLVVSSPVSFTSDNTTNTITVHYHEPGVTVEGMSIQPGETTVLGRGGSSYSGDHYSHGRVLIRDDYSETDPTTPEGQAVLLHELMHTLGASHSQQGSGEIMEPDIDGSAGPELGPGDIHILGELGCW